MPTLWARDLLPARFLTGPGYEIHDRVEIHGHRYLVRASTNYGEVTAFGLPMLELRFHEHFAIQALRQTPGLQGCVKSILGAVIEAPAGAKILLTDPIGSVIRYPQGVHRGLRKMVDRLDKRGGGLVRRRLAHRVNADPETRNPFLAKLLDQLARREGMLRWGTEMCLSTAVPVLGMLATNERNRLIISQQSPRKVAASVRSRLVHLGIKAKVSNRFATDLVMTSTEKLNVLSHLETLKGVRGLWRLVAITRAIQCEATLLSYLQQVQLISGVHRQDPIESIEVGTIPILTLRSGNVVAIAAVDVVPDTDLVRENVARFHSRIRRGTTSLLISGLATEQARHRLQSAGIKVIDLADFDRYARAS